MCTLCAALRPGDMGAEWKNHEGAPSGSASSTSRSELQQIADYLVRGYWDDQDVPPEFSAYDEPRKFNVSPGGTLTYQLSDMSKAERDVAKAALQAWTDVSGIKFREVSSSSADIIFQNSDPEGAYSFPDLGGTIDDGFREIRQALVNVPEDWDRGTPSLNSYWFQTYLHEIGHALGLGHAGNYNGDAEFGPDHEFKQDSWQASVMSYFAQTDNPHVDASFAFITTLMPADILAIQEIYGTNVNNNNGSTVYGHNSNVGGYLGRMFDAMFDGKSVSRTVYKGEPATFTIYDTGGSDTVNFATVRRNQKINLNDGTASDVKGLKGNMLIALGTLIENAVGGKRNDRIIGNEAGNRLSGMNGNDKLEGASGADRLTGGTGADKLAGGTGSDTLTGGTGNDAMAGGSGTDLAVFTGRQKIVLNLNKTNAQNTGQGRDTLRDIENATTGRGNDRITGDEDGNRLNSGGGKDVLKGGGGADVLLSGGANDRLFGQKAGDTLTGGDGSDALFGGDGRDALSGQNGNDRIEGNGGNDTLSGGNGSDRLFGGADQDGLTGGEGRDTLDGGGGNDTLSGGAAGDRLLGGTGNDALSGDEGDDALLGGSGNDTLSGGDGNDTLSGDAGNDALTGGAGSDEFRFTGGLDTVADFEDNADTVTLSKALWNGTEKTVEQVLAEFAFNEGGNVVFRFQAGMTELVLTGIADKAALIDDLMII